MDENYYLDLVKVRIQRAVKLFNYNFVHGGDGTFNQDDYKMVVKLDQIRNASDYDDFYIANKEETNTQVENADILVTKIRNFLEKDKSEYSK